MSAMLSYRAIFSIAIPMILSNVTVPLLGLVDTAVIGHLPYSYYLGGVAIGSTVVSFIFWLSGFLRMSTTGVVAQAMGRADYQQAVDTWRQSALLGWGIAIVLIVLQWPIWQLAALLSDADGQVTYYAHIYYQIRIWGAPAALMHYATLGCLLGMKRAKAPMTLLIWMNVINISLDLIFVMGFHWGVAGAAGASLIADYAGAIGGVWLLWRAWKHLGVSLLPQSKTLQVHWHKLWHLLRLNRDIFLRTLALQLCFGFITFEGAKLGTLIVAANAVLMNFMVFTSYALDGFAYAVEALAGHAMGQQNRAQLEQCVRRTCKVAVGVSLGFSLIYWGAGKSIIAGLTSIELIREQAADYLPWLVIMPVIAVSSYIFDGVYIAVTQGRIMRNGMLVSAFVVFFPVWWLTRSWGNHGLWFALSCFMLARGVTLIAHYLKYHKTWFR
ncbi:MATE family efflux transporter [Celerinatantimonas sp. YJH-8]|uniref:MATE family efflux transporter n=1 Tax=Celerinatantimonas sp. YJH-8 TaxID=3228714 RepID=UPI0038C2C066